MIKFDLIFCLLVFLPSEGGSDLGTNDALPSWITSKPAFQNPKPKDSVETGFGSLSHKDKGDAGWLVTLNDKEGHGVELELEKLSMNPDSNDFLLVSPCKCLVRANALNTIRDLNISNQSVFDLSWCQLQQQISPSEKREKAKRQKSLMKKLKGPMTGSFKRIKLYSGKFSKPLKPLRIPNTKTFLALYSVSQATNSPEMVLNYKRYGSPLELAPLPTSDPIKKKETIYEIQLRGKALEEYNDAGFLKQVKEAIRARAKRFCAAHEIKFNENIPTQKMVVIHRVSFCPFEWPDRHICASLEHSVFVSGVELPDQELIRDYELVKSNLKKMWKEGDLAELEALGITVFRLPPTSSTAAYWSLLIGLTIISSLIIALIIRNVHRKRISRRKESLEYDEVVKVRQRKFKLHEHQTVPAFILNQRDPNMIRLEGQLQKEISEYNAAVPKSQETSKAPIKNYVASMIFGDNKAFDDDEDYTVEFRQKTPPKK